MSAARSMCHPSNFENHRLNQYCCQLTWFSNVFEATHRKRTGALQVGWRRASDKPIMGRSSSSRGKKGISIESHLQNQRGFPSALVRSLSLFFQLGHSCSKQTTDFLRSLESDSIWYSTRERESTIWFSDNTHHLTVYIYVPIHTGT